MNEEELLAQEQMRKEKKKFEKKHSKKINFGFDNKKKYRKVRKDKHITDKTKEAILKGEQLKL